MGLRRIGRRISRGFRRVGRAFRSIAKVGGKILSKVTKPFRKIIEPFKKIMSGLLDKLPFGKLLKGFIGKFLKNPLALLSGGVLGGLGAMLTGAKDPRALLGAVNQMRPTPAYCNPQGRANVFTMVAIQHATFIR